MDVAVGRGRAPVPEQATRDAGRAFRFEAAQGRAELRQIVRAEQPPARWTAVADNAGARVPGGFGPMVPRDGAVEHVAQYVMTAVRAARLAVPAEAEHPGPRAVRLDPQHEALQGGIVDRVFALEGRAARASASVRRARSAMVRLPFVQHRRESARDPVRRVEHGTLREMRIAERRRDVGVAEQPGDDAKALAAVDRDRRMGVPQVVNAELSQSRQDHPSGCGNGAVDSKNIKDKILELFDYSDEPGRALLFYLYGILSSATYLEMFEGILYRGADPSHPPRIPIFADADVRKQVSHLGCKVALCENTGFTTPHFEGLIASDLAENEEFRLTKSVIDTDNSALHLYENNSLRAKIEGIPSDTLTLRIAGHDVVQKWLRERKFTYLRRTFRSADLEALKNLLGRISHQQLLINQLDKILDQHLSLDSVSNNSLRAPIPIE